MAQIKIHYNRYSFDCPTISEDEFYLLKKILELDPDFDCFDKKFFWLELNQDKHLLMLTYLLLISLIIWPLLILWFFLGGLFSLLNFINNIRGYNKYHSELKKKLPTFKTYNQYMYFRKYEGLQYMSMS